MALILHTLSLLFLFTIEVFIKFLIIITLIFISSLSFAQVDNKILSSANDMISEKNSVPKEVKDSEIQDRLEKIFKATGWFPNLKVEVTEGLVILQGEVENQEKKDWALKIIDKTQGVVAVIEKLDNSFSSNTVLKPAQNEVTKIYNRSYKMLPYVASAIVLLIIFVLLAYFFRKGTQLYLTKGKNNPLLVKSVANIIGVVFIILGIYFALKISGLSDLAVTMLGGTGMLGIGLGLALKNTFENYTSSIMISLKELIRLGELVNINGFEGIVQSVTTRGTTLLDYEGNNIIIPNSTVFNSPIKNLTRNPKMRTNFLVGIGYDDDINTARTIIINTLKEMQPMVLNDPEWIVAVDNLGSATINLNIYFWFDAINISVIKIKSLVIQNVKEALVEGNISLPDDAREVVFTSPLKILNLTSSESNDKLIKYNGENQSSIKKIDKPVKEIHNHNLENEIKDLKKQAMEIPEVDSGTNIV